MGTYTDLTSFLKTKLEGISKIVEVVDNPELDFENFPVVTIVPADGESDFETNVEDERIYAYELHVFYETKTSGISFALDAIYDAIDDILDSFASDKQLATFNPGTNRTVLFVEPVSAGWGEVQDKDLVFARVNLRVKVSILN